MGADLYIRRLYAPHEAQARPAFDAAVRDRNAYTGSDPAEKQRLQAAVAAAHEAICAVGYFRDSYNSTSVLATLNLSWWRDVIPMLNRQGNLSGEALRRFRDMVATASQDLPDAARLKERGAQVDAQGENSVAGWHAYYQKERQDLLAFLDLAIAHRYSVHCSL